MRHYWAQAACLVALAALLQLLAGNGHTPIPTSSAGASRPHAQWSQDARVADGEAPILLRQGDLPWWSSRDLRQAPWRPVSSVVNVWIARSAAPEGLRHALEWGAWLCLCGGFAALARELLPKRRALLALALFLGTRAHWTALSLSDSLGLLLALALGVASLWRYVRAGSGRSLDPIGLACLALALLCHPIASGFALLLIGLEVGWGSGSLGRRVWSLATWLTLCSARIIGPIAAGYGYRETARFPDPWGAPERLWSSIQAVAPESFVEGLWGATLSGPDKQLSYICATLLAIALLRGGRTRATDGALLAAVLASIAVASVPFQAELMLLPKIAIALFCAGVLGALDSTRTPLEGVTVTALSLAMLAGQLVVAPCSGVAQVRQDRAAYGARWDRAQELRGTHGAHVFVLNLGADHDGRAAPFEPAAMGWPVLSSARGPLLLRRLGPRALELQTTTAGIFSGPFTRDHAASGPGRFAPGDRITSSRFSVTVRAVGFDGPTRFQIKFPHALTDDLALFLRGTGDGFEPVSLPAVGEVRLIAPAQLAFAEELPPR